MKKIYLIILFIILSSSVKSQWLPDIWFENSNGYASLSKSVAAGNNIVHVVWHDFRLSTWEIYYKRSIDNGLNWSSDTRLTFNAGQSDNPSIFANGLNVYLVWHDNTNGYFEIYFKKSTDGGISWSSDIRISNSNYNTVNLHPSLFVSGSFIHVVWHDLRDGNKEIYYNRSSDNGINWGTDTRLTYNSAESEFATISGSGSTVNVSWKDNRDGNFEIYQKLSTNNGINWSSDYRLTNYTGVSQSPSISASGSNVFLVWDDNRFGNSQIFYKISTDGGLNWSSESEFTTSSVSSVRPSIISSGAKIHVTWYEENTSGIFYKYSSNSGISWDSNTYLTTAYGICHCTGPSITVAEQAVHIVWTVGAGIHYKGNPSQNSSYINLTSPNGGENFISGSIPNITWITNSSSNIKLELTTNNGNSWSIITSSYPADSGRYSWTIPSISSSQCKIKISDANDPSLYDVSENVFSVLPVTLNTGLVAYYPLNGDANDESGNENNGTIHGASQIQDRFGNQNHAYYFNGVNNWINVADNNLLDFTNKFTIAGWFNTSEDLSNMCILGKGRDFDLSGYNILIKNDKLLSVGVNNGTNSILSSDLHPQTSSWYFFSAVYSGDTLKLFINGTLNNKKFENLTLLNSNQSLNIGRETMGLGRYFKGSIDDLRFYDRTLSQSEIQQLYNQESQIVINIPSISISPIQINPGGSVSITGQNFRANAQVKVNVTSSNSELVLDQIYTTNSAGGFNANYSSNVNSSPGIYTVSAYDIATSQNAPNKIFEVTELPETFDLTLTSPNSDTVDRIIDVEWRDKMIPMSGYSIVNIKRYYKYKINFTTDNGTNWSSDIYSEGFEFINSTPVFSKQISLPPLNSIQAGTVIKFKVTDYISTSRYSESQNIHIRNSELTKSNISLVWDFSYPNPNRAPKGVSADGVSRFYLKISKNSGSPAISSVTIHLTDDKINTDIKYLGKLKIATITNDFSTEADNANLIQISNSGQIDYWFWYVSPDDFVRAGADDELKNQRTVTANVKVNYSDATTEYGNQNILIARPPLMFLHGIGSNGYLWNDYSINFIRLFKVIETPSYNSAYGFRDIGNALLNWNNENPYNPLSFQNAVYKIRNAGFATNQVYYISHSMGGNIARAASEIPYYNSKQNYYKGHINRLITMDTPNNGSPIADFVIYTLPLINNLEKFTKWGEVTKLAIKGIIKSRLVDLLNSTLKLEENSVFSDISPTASLKNLQISGNGSYKFRITPIKSFLFAGDFFPGENIIFSNTNYNIIGKGGFNKLFEYLEKVIQITLYPNLINLFYTNEDKQSALNIFKKRNVSVSEKVTKILELVYKKIFNSNSSIFNSDLIVSVNSQLANTPRTYANTYDSFNGDYGRFFGISHTNILSNPCTKDTLIRSKIKNLISLPLSYNEFLQTIPLTPSNSINNPFEYSDNFTSNSFDTTKVLNIVFPEEGHICIVDSIVNISFNINDTTDLQYVNISFQGENYYDTVKSLSYIFNLNVNSNELDSSYIQVSAVYLKNDSLIVSEDLKKVVIKTLSNPIEFEVSGNFFELFKGDIIFPTYKTVYPGFIHNGNTKDIAAIVDNTSIIVFDNISKSFKAISTGETFAIVSNGVHSDTIYFNVIGEILVPGNTDLVYPVDQAYVPSSDLKLSWNIVDYASQYSLQIAEDINFENIVYRNSNIYDTVTTVSDISDSVKYYWRVKAINSAGSGNWSSVRTFITYPLFNAHFYITVIPQGFYNESTNSLRKKDTVKAYLMNINSPYNIIDSASSVIDSISHQGLFNFVNATNGTYYLKVKHRNSIESWSKSGGEVFTKYSTMNYDFTSSQSQAFGSNLIQIGSAWCIYSGDVNQDEVIDASDMSEVDNDAYNSVSGYVRTDVTGDDFVDAEDMSIVDNNAFNSVSVIRP